MKEKLLKLKKKYGSLLKLSLEIPISESTLYNFVNDYKPISTKSKNKIYNFIKNQEV